ncbi:CheR family methyltransferase [Clostridium hydrogenum]|uniref:CheR family methyltransferase n=1 Tax=Clostridium hydrogenum TaxID=2855764 RepID=UPI001F2E94E7|nr:protein-glutamate O-methyltransferase CheR [Clostridium hydrogenum]
MDSFSDMHFKKYSDLLYKKVGIFISQNKRETFKMKIDKSMAKQKLKSYDEHLSYLQKKDSAEYFQQFVNDITTNTTEFFREKEHFDFIEQNLKTILKNNPRILNSGEIRIWSAGCSSGQEPVTLSIFFKECFRNKIDVKILATDIDSKILSEAIKGKYSFATCETIPKSILLKYFHKTGETFSVNEEIKESITYRHFNLMNDYNFKKGFDIIFCRNVMIYFDNAIQQKLADKFYNQLIPGGLLFISHSESLLNKTHNYKYLGPAIYMK